MQITKRLRSVFGPLAVLSVGILIGAAGQSTLNAHDNDAIMDPANPYTKVILDSEAAFMKREIEGATATLDDDYVLYDIKEEGAVPRMRGKDNVRKILGSFFEMDTSWTDSTVERYGLIRNILVQVEHDVFVKDGVETVIPSLIVFEHRDGKRWREWRFSPQDR